MIASFVVQENPTLKKENIIIGLSQIENGSIGLQFEPNLADLTLPATGKLTTKRGQINGLFLFNE